MKKYLLMIIAILTLANIVSYAETSECWVHVKVDPLNGDAPGHLDYNENCQCCYDVGNNCQIVSCDDYKKANEQRVSGGILISDIKLIPINFKLNDENGIVTREFTNDGINYTMTGNFSLRITDSSEFPEINGIEVSLDGISTDDNGFFSVFIPSGGY